MINARPQRIGLYQIITYVVYFPTVFMTFANIPLLFESAVHYTIFGLFTLLSLVSSFLTTISEPIDTMITLQYEFRKKNQLFDYDSYHLESFCDLCSAYVQENTKHCRKCNRCCEQFDHHCKWVNNCIGRRNYRLFVVMISSAFGCFLYSFIVNTRVVYLYTTDYQRLHENGFYTDDMHTKMVVSVIIMVVSGLALVLLLQLIVFHIYIACKNITTYDYITNRAITKVMPAQKQQDQSQIFNQQKDQSRMEMTAHKFLDQTFHHKALSIGTKNSDKDKADSPHKDLQKKAQTVRHSDHKQSSLPDLQFHTSRDRISKQEEVQPTETILTNINFIKCHQFDD